MVYQRNRISYIHRKTLNPESHEPNCGIILKTWDHAGYILFHSRPPIFREIIWDKVSLWLG